MAEKFAVGEALNETFQFAIHRWGSVLRFGWAPIALVIALSFGLVWMIVDINALEAAEDNPEILVETEKWLKTSWATAIVLIGVGSVAMSFILAGFMASVYRLVALGEERPGFIHLRFDGPAQRVFIANLILSLINFGIYAVAFLIASATTGFSPGEAFAAIGEFLRIVSEAAQAGGQVDESAFGDSIAPVGLFFIAFVYAVLPMIYINIRLAPFLSGSAAENRLLLLGSFRLTGGNFWGLFGFYLLLFIVMMVIVFAFQIIIGILDALSALPSSGLFALIGYIAGAISFIATVAYQVFAYAIQFGAQGVIYRRLKTGS